jgi:hypothetical protein
MIELIAFAAAIGSAGDSPAHPQDPVTLLIEQLHGQSLGARVIARPGHDFYAEIPTRCREFTRARILERWY